MSQAIFGHWGRCQNYGNCRLAGHKLPTTPGEESLCPECGTPLKPVASVFSTIPLPIMIGAGTVLLIAIALVTLFALQPCWLTGKGCSGPLATTKPILRLGGSNTIGDKLGPALAEAWLKTRGCDAVSRTSPAKDELVLSCVASDKPLVVTVSSHGTETGFDGLKSGKYDIAMASDQVTPQTVSDLADLGTMNSAAAEHVIGFDGVAVVVNRGNPVSQLTLDQVARLFSGDITNWSEVGGSPGPVHVYIRDSKSGTRKFFERKVMTAYGRHFSPSAQEFEKGTDLADAVASDPGAIGFVGAASAEVAKPIAIQATAGGAALVPNTLTIRTLDYALSRKLYLYVPPQRTSSEVAQFLSFARTSAALDVVDKSGFTSRAITTGEGNAARTFKKPQGYTDATRASNRLTFNFYFQTGSSKLDNLGESDIDYLTDFLSRNRVYSSRLLLIGFTDNVGDDQYNILLSIDRAQAVAERLERAGIKATNVVGFGEAMPIADNSTEEGRNQNRRVEVWVRP
jgi:phosphate transport system substrate-binding protein